MNLSTILVSLLIFGFLIVIHELGHFIAAKLSGVYVEEFAVGMGPKIFSKKGKETLYTVRILPVGGFCKMLGEDENNYSEKSFNSKSKGKRALILFAGSFMNFIGTVLILCIIFFMIGNLSTTIAAVDTNFPAYQAGIESGDKIVSINNQPINSWQEIVNVISDSDNSKNFNITVLRNNDKTQVEEAKNFIISSKYDSELQRYRIGITPEKKRSIILSIKNGFAQTFDYMKLMLGFFGSLFKGNVSTDDLVGPIGVVSIVGQTVQYGALAILNLAAIISLNLAIFNLLPIPALDGSRIMFILIEAIKGSPIEPEKEGMIHFAGFVLLMVLAVFIAYKDILRFK